MLKMLKKSYYPLKLFGTIRLMLIASNDKIYLLIFLFSFVNAMTDAILNYELNTFMTHIEVLQFSLFLKKKKNFLII